MKATFRMGWLLGFACFCGGASAQTAVMRLQATNPSLQVQQGGTITIEVFLDTNTLLSTTHVRGYQGRIVMTPRVGATGSLSLADPACPDTPDDPANTAIFIDTARSDYLFFPPLPGGMLVFPAVNCPNLVVLAAGTTPGVGPFTVPKYLGTYILRASPTASGLHDVNLILPPDPVAGGSFIRNQNNQPIPLAVQGLTVTVIPPGPPNDECVDAVPISDGLTSFTTVSATTNPSGPALSSSCDDPDDLDGTSFVNDVWFDYTATCTGIVTVSTCGLASFDTRLAVYDGDTNSACACPSLGSPIIACDDDAPGCANETAEVFFNATQGACFKIRLGGLSADTPNTGTGTLSVACVSNDTCATATLITGSLPQTRLSSTRNTNPESGLPACGPFGTSTSAGGVWFTVTGTGNLMTASLCATGTTYNSRLSVFGGTCGALTCVNAADNNCGVGPHQQKETVSWCSTSGVPYRILVHGFTNTTGDFALTVSSSVCDDANACTTNACSNNACAYTSTTPPGMCCDPTPPGAGNLCTIDDNNPCTSDSCAVDGSCVHANVPNGPDVACDDELRCTFDQCLNGSCANTNINTLACSISNPCPAGSGSACISETCRCIENPTLDLVGAPGGLPNPSCYSVGDIITINVQMGFSPTPILAAQMFLEYDASTLAFVSMDPGRTFDSTSPFNFELQQIVNATNGTIDYAVAVPPGPGQPGTAVPALVAVLRMQAIDECYPFVRFRAHTPSTALLDASATAYVPITSDLPQIQVNGSLPALSSCPGNLSTGFDTDEYSATVNFATPGATDNCDGPLTVTCSPAAGSEFVSGTTSVTCSAVNSCGVADDCSFDVTILPSTLTVDVQLSPTIVPVPRQRCLTLDLWHCATGRHATVETDATFVNGIATGAITNIPGGPWSCVTARDRVHTLRSKAPAPLQNVNFRTYDADFLGDLDFGGHWLLGGNLNDDGYIDITDYVIFLQQYLLAPGANVACSDIVPNFRHADINGSGTVDVADLSFIQVSMFTASEPACCPSAVAAEDDTGPVTSISVQELRNQGLGYLGIADLNGDDVLDYSDMERFIELQPSYDPIKPYARIPVQRDPSDVAPRPESIQPSAPKVPAKPRR